MKNTKYTAFKNPLIVALDTDSAEEALSLARSLSPWAGGFKIGLQLYTSAGPEVVRLIAEQAPVFADLKLHDIPNTVAAAAAALVRWGAYMINVHAAGGREMMRAAAMAAREEARKKNLPEPILLAVTVLTSIDREIFNREIGLPGEIVDKAAAWALLAKEAGLDGVVASPREVPAIKEACGRNFLVVTPGVRPPSSAQNDQKRTAAPRQAMELGSDYLVVGRPITAAPDPVRAAAAILEEIKSFCR